MAQRDETDNGQTQVRSTKLPSAFGVCLGLLLLLTIPVGAFLLYEYTRTSEGELVDKFANAWIGHKPVGGGYSVNFPPGPMHGEESSGSKGPLEHRFSVEQNGLTFSCGSTLLPEGSTTDLKASLIAVAAKSEGKVLGSSDTTLDSVPALEFEIQNAKGFTVGRMAIKDRHLFRWNVSGENAKLTDADAQRFLKSFKLVGTASTVPVPKNGPMTPPRNESPSQKGAPSKKDGPKE